jgi:hypothetical protein
MSTEIDHETYLSIAKESTVRLMASPSHRHFDAPRKTHLHAVMQFDKEGEKILCSFIQRGSKVRFYSGGPIWSDWMRQTPGKQPRLYVIVPRIQ